MSRKTSRDFVKIPTPKECRRPKDEVKKAVSLDKRLDLTDHAQRMQWIKIHRPTALKTKHKISQDFKKTL